VSNELFGVAGDHVIESFLLKDTVRTNSSNEADQVFLTGLCDELVIE
jgi:hypothetical protein